jgi:hypothetical protein
MKSRTEYAPVAVCLERPHCILEPAGYMHKDASTKIPVTTSIDSYWRWYIFHYWVDPARCGTGGAWLFSPVAGVMKRLTSPA